MFKLDNIEDQQGSITVYMNILKKVCNGRLEPKVGLGVPGFKIMQMEADLEARAQILKGDSFYNLTKIISLLKCTNRLQPPKLALS
jgi:hypothetical protein